MPATRLHFVRHGEVHNPRGVLYGRLPEFGLSERGHQMAAAAAKSLFEEGIEVARLRVSPLQRTQESARPWAELYGLEPELEPRVIEPWNKFEGYRMGPRALLANPTLARHLMNPRRPSWGEPYVEIADRMRAAAEDLYNSTESGHAVVVSHQLPIWMLYSQAAGLALPHDPRSRRCNLSSITSFDMVNGLLVPVDYREVDLSKVAN